MLRLGFLPSDFNPMLLILAEDEGFRLLAAALRRFAADAAPVRLDRLTGAVAGVALTLEAADGPPGLIRLPGPDAGFAWRLDAILAADFAARAARLAQPDQPAGADFLTCGGSDEIPVKLSRGEYTDDFLLPPDLPGTPGWDSKTSNEREA